MALRQRIQCPCGAWVEHHYELFMHLDCQPPRLPAPPAPPVHEARVHQERRKIVKLIDQLKGLSRREHRHRPQRRH
jgi:hypothetical protein